MTDALAIAGFAVPVVAYFWMIHHYGVNVVFLDQWGDVGIMQHSYSGTLSLGTLWAQHSEQRIFFPNLIVLALGYATHLNVVFEEYLSALLLCLSALLLVWSHRRRCHTRSWIYYCPVPILMLSLVQSKSTIFGFQLAWYLLIVMLAVAIYLLDRPSLTAPVLAGAMAAAVVGSFSSLPGLFIWPAGLVLLYHRRRRLSQVIGWCLAAAASVVVYSYHYDTSQATPANVSGLHLRGAAFHSFFQVIGSVLGVHLTNGNGGVNLAVLLFGVLLFLIALYAVVTRGLRRDDTSGAPVGIAVICFGLLYALSFAYARAWAGPATASAPQYTTFTLLLVVGSYLALLDPAARPISAALPKAATRVVTLVLLGAIGLQVVFGTINGLKVATGFHQTQVQAAVVLTDFKRVPIPILQSAVGSWWLAPDVARSYASTVEAHHLSVFDSGNVAGDRQQALAEERQGRFHYVAPPPTSVLRPLDGQSLTGTAVLDAEASGDLHPKRVEFHLLTGTQDMNLGPAKLTLAGWIRHWDTTSVHDATYRLQSVVYGDRGITRSAPITVVIANG